jgi:hypothetical protein
VFVESPYRFLKNGKRKPVYVAADKRTKWTKKWNWPLCFWIVSIGLFLFKTTFLGLYSVTVKSTELVPVSGSEVGTSSTEVFPKSETE